MYDFSIPQTRYVSRLANLICPVIQVNPVIAVQKGICYPRVVQWARS